MITAPPYKILEMEKLPALRSPEKCTIERSKNKARKTVGTIIHTPTTKALSII
jgi:hypothetical protein